MTGRWWIGVAAGVALGLGGVVAVEASTHQAAAQGGGFTLSREQLKTNQRISIAAVKRVNQAQKDIAYLGNVAPLYAVSNGAVGSSLVRGRGAVSVQRIDVGNYRVKFGRNINVCSWSATPAADAPPVPDITSVRLALDTTDVARTQLVVRTIRANGEFADGAFHVQVFC